MRRRLRRALHAPLPAWGCGLALTWLAERGSLARLQTVCWAAATACFVAAVVASLWRLAMGPASRRSAYVLLLRGYVVQVWALAGYAAMRAGRLDVLGPLLGWVQVALPAWLAWGLLPTLALEHAVATTEHAPVLEPGRVREAQRAARLTWCLGVSFAALNYAATALGMQVDLSRLRRTEPSAGTLAAVTGLTVPLRVTAFFPPGNAVLEGVRPYLAALRAASPALQLEVLDHPFAGERARALGVRGNGAVALEAKGRTEVLALPLDLEHARRDLRRLDAELGRRLVALLRPLRTAYLTAGHGEWPLAEGAGRAGRDLSALHATLMDEGYVVRLLGPAEGLGREVPDDAALLAVIGPSEAFGPQEQASVARYLRRGGRLLLAIDAATLPPRSAGTRGPGALAALLGVALTQAPVANAAFGVRLGSLGAGASYDLLTTHATTHPATASLRRHPGRVGLVLPGAAGVRRADDAPAGLRIETLLPPMPGSWLDLNRNGRRDAGEPVDDFALAVAVTGAGAALTPEPAAAATAAPATASGRGTGAKPDGHADAAASGNLAANGTASAGADAPELRAVVVGDADFAGSSVMRNPGNAAFVADALRWLAGDLAAPEGGAARQDVALVHRRADDAVTFYGVCYGVPGGLLLAAAVRGRRGRAQRPPDDVDAPRGDGEDA